jgi:cytoskeletal protein CcmA (bactofilin family)
MNCLTELTLSMYVEGVETEDGRDAIEEHLRACAHCARLKDALAAENRLLTEVLVQTAADAASPAQALVRPFVSRSGAMGLFGAGVLVGLAMNWAATQFAPAAVWLERLFSAWPVAVAIQATLQLSGYSDAVNRWVDSLSTAFLLAGAAGLTWLALRRVSRAPGAIGVVISLALLLAAPGFGMVRRGGQTVSVGAGETLDDTLLATGDTVRIDGTVNGDVIAMGREMQIRGTVKGDVMFCGQYGEITGTVEGNVVAFANSLRIVGRVGRNVYAGLQSLRLGPSSQVEGEVVVGAQTVDLEGTVTRSVLAGTPLLRGFGSIGRNLTMRGGALELDKSARVGGDVSAYVRDPKDVRIAPGAVIAGKTSTHLTPAKGRANRYTQPSFYIWRAVELAGALLVAWLMLTLAPTFVEGATRAVGSPWRSLGLGFAVLVATPVAILLAAITLIGLPLALLALALYLAALYLAKIFVAAYIGRMLRLHVNGGIGARLLVVLLGLVVIIVAVQLPFKIGFALHLAVLCFGLGGFAWQLSHARARP